MYAGDRQKGEPDLSQKKKRMGIGGEKGATYVSTVIELCGIPDSGSQWLRLLSEKWDRLKKNLRLGCKTVEDTRSGHWDTLNPSLE